MSTVLLKNYKKRISISSKRQITIPQKVFDILGFESQAECIVRDNELVIRPVKEQGYEDFSDLILSDLVKRGLSGDELLSEFRKEQVKMRGAISAIKKEATNVALGKEKGMTLEEVFGKD